MTINNKLDDPLASDLAEQASNMQPDEIQRQLRRGDETKGDPDDRDAAGTTASKDTPQGREEAKNDTAEKVNING